MKQALLQLTAGRASWCQHSHVLGLDLFETKMTKKVRQCYKSCCFIQNLTVGNYANCLCIMSNFSCIYKLLNGQLFFYI